MYRTPLFNETCCSHGGCDAKVSEGKRREGRRGVWQRRFWEHAIKDEDDFQTHFDYVHFNPVKHKLVKCPGDWEASSFHRWVKAGVYPPDWGCGKYSPPILLLLGAIMVRRFNY